MMSKFHEIVVDIFEDETRTPTFWKTLDTLQNSDQRSAFCLLNYLFAREHYRFSLHPAIDQSKPKLSGAKYFPNKYGSRKIDGCGVYRNTDSIARFFREKDWIKHNPNFASLSYLRSDGSKMWTSYNWVIIRTLNKKYQLRVGLHKNSYQAELGIKHSILAFPNQVIAAGELRIVVPNDTGKPLYQFNFNSSIGGYGSMRDSSLVREYHLEPNVFRKFLAYKLEEVFARYLGTHAEVELLESRIVFNERDRYIKQNTGYYNKGLVPPEMSGVDDMVGLAYWYYQRPLPCPRTDFVDSLNDSRSEEDEYFYHLKDSSQYLKQVADLFPKQ